MDDREKNKWQKGGWFFLISDFIGNMNQMMALKIKEKIKEEKIILEKRIAGIFLLFLGMLIFFFGLAILIGSLIGQDWSGWIIVGGGLALFSILLFKS